MRRTVLVGLVLAMATSCAGAGRPTMTDETVPERDCSADGMTIGPLDSDGLPSAVARRRQALIDAAVACDYGTLRQIARADGVAISFDGQRVPAAQWQDREAEGLAILRPLAGLLALANTSEGDGAERTFTWPTAVDWPFADVADASEREALVDVVGEAGIYGWGETGGYAGWRTSISNDGTWATFYLGPVDEEG